MIYRLFKKWIDAEVDRRVNENAELDFLKSVKKLDVQNDDVVIVEHPYHLKQETHWNLKIALERLIRAYGFDVNVIILEEGMRLSTSSKEDTGLDHVVSSDKEFLKWLWARLYYLHGESPDSDYMHRLLEVAEQVGFDEEVIISLEKRIASNEW